jgi:putative nucleotidyltransferase with HDIG domain
MSPHATASEIVERIHELPALPGVVVHMNEALTSPRTSARDVAAILSSDPAIASKLLGMANSAYYGLGQRVGTVTHAVMVLGFNTVRNVVLTSTIVRSLNAFAPRYDHVRFWRHSVACGALSRILAHRMGEGHGEELFLLGLLHDVGKVIIGSCKEADVARISTLMVEGMRRCPAEEVTIGTDHAAVGAALLERWRLPRVFVDAVRHHHTPALAGEHKVPTAIVHVADVLVQSLLFTTEDGERVSHLSHDAWALVRLSPEVLPSIFQQTFEAVARAESFLEVVAGRGGG